MVPILSQKETSITGSNAYIEHNRSSVRSFAALFIDQPLINN